MVTGKGEGKDRHSCKDACIICIFIACILHAVSGNQYKLINTLSIVLGLAFGMVPTTGSPAWSSVMNSCTVGLLLLHQLSSL